MYHAIMECSRKKRLVRELNDILTCQLCHGYLVDATTLVECLHTFCRGCILRHFESSKTQTQCPICPVLYKKKSQCFRSDTQLQALVYKVVPSLYLKEMQRREDFYRSTGRAGSSCSDDSVIDRERDMMHETEEMISQYVGDKTQYFSQDDSISLSLEYYQAHLDTTHTNSDRKYLRETNSLHTNTNNSDNTFATSNTSVEKSSDSKCDAEQTNARGNGQICSDKPSEKIEKVCDKRYLQCPAGVNMKHLQKFVRMKYGLTADHRVDIIYKGEVLPNDFSLMDVAYTFLWEKKKPMRFFYRIFTPLKIRPIKIVNTPTATGGKQLQIVPVTTNNHLNPASARHEPPKSPRTEKSAEIKETKTISYEREETESEQQDKEILLANLQLQSKSKALQIAEAKKVQVPEKIVKECVFEYEEPDQEEIKRFAEKRDREWALQKKLEEEIKPDLQDYFSSRDNYPTKKRKKSKHSKTDSNGHKEKKRKMHADKIHAEITNNDKSDLKLKVKITTNGHKHKHHKIENSSELTHKEKLLQMRQVRHKHMSGSSGDERTQTAIPTIKLPKSYAGERTKESDNYSSEPEPKRKKESSKLAEYPNSNNISENNNKPLESQSKPRIEPMIIKPLPNANDGNTHRAIPSASRSQPGISSAKVVKKDGGLKSASFEQTDRQSQKTFLKTTSLNTEKYSKDQKVSQGKMESLKTTGSVSNKVLPVGSITTNNKTLDRKIASLQQRCTIEPKNPVRLDNGKFDKMNINNEKTKNLTPQYPPGFTVSKIESGVKRKIDESEQDKRPSLEITLIPPTTSTPTKPTENKPVNKRPPPGTIPLERIKNAVNLKSGISIIPKMPDRSDNTGVLDLSKPNKSPENSPRSSPKTEPINGLNSMVNRQLSSMAPRPMNSPGRATPESKNMQLSNLQMLSKVATEHPTLNKVTPNNVNKIRPQLPNLQTISKMPALQSSPNAIRPPGLQRMPPKLNDIQKFRPSNPQIRNLRPNQNQNIRNIPNPSLMLNRHQNLNQNRLVSSANTVQTTIVASEKKVSSPKSSPPVTSSTNSSAAKEIPSLKTAIIEQKVSESKEISV